MADGSTPGPSGVAVGFDPFAPGFSDDPYPQWTALRETAPVYESPFGLWVLTGYDDVSALLRSRLSVEDRNVTTTGPVTEMYREVLGDDAARRAGGLSMLDRDPPDHTRLRRLVSSAFTPRTVAELEPLVVRLVDERLAAIEAAGRVNLIDELAFPLPFAVITEMLGMPPTDTVRLRELSHLVVRSLEPVPDPDTVRAIVAAEEEMTALAAAAIAGKRREPADDLLTALIQAEDDGDVLSDDELTAQVILLYLAGHETTVNLIGNGMLALLSAPDELARLRQDPGLDEGAVEELLRYDCPVQLSRRVTLEPYGVGGYTIPPGSFVIASLAAANRDPAHFGADADRVRIDRAEARAHLSFGAGVHHCLGAALARLEGRLAVGGLARRFPDLQLSGQPVWNGRINLRGLADLPVTVS
jgi:cytochrome P450